MDKYQEKVDKIKALREVADAITQDYIVIHDDKVDAINDLKLAENDINSYIKSCYYSDTGVSSGIEPVKTTGPSGYALYLDKGREKAWKKRNGID